MSGHRPDSDCLGVGRLRCVGRTDWTAWHHHYDDPDSRATRRLGLLQERIRWVLDHAPPGTIRAIVPCAGQGRDLLGSLIGHPRRNDVTATLLETDAANAATARAFAQRLELPAITVVEADAGLSDSYAGAVPASLVILSGFFDYLDVDDLDRLVDSLPQLCASDATVLWTRRVVADFHPPESLRARFQAAGFRRVENDLVDDDVVHVGIERFEGTPAPFEPGRRLFTFRDPTPPAPSTTTRVKRHLARRARSAARHLRGRTG